jgi:hypothetical protein
VEFAPTFPVFERVKPFHAFDLASTVIGEIFISAQYQEEGGRSGLSIDVDL